MKQAKITVEIKLKKAKSYFYLHYVEGCTPKVKRFKSEKGINKFLASFVTKYGSLDDKGDNWVELDKLYYGVKL